MLNAPMKLFGFVFREVPGRAADGLCHFLADTDSSGARVQSEYEQALRHPHAQEAFPHSQKSSHPTTTSLRKTASRLVEAISVSFIFLERPICI